MPPVKYIVKIMLTNLKFLSKIKFENFTNKSAFLTCRKKKIETKCKIK